MNNKSKCRVVGKQHDLYKVKIETGIRDAKVKGSFIYNAQTTSDFPCVGDWVNAFIYDDIILIDEIIDRKTHISRKVAGSTTEEQIIAANIDYVAIVLGLDGGRNYSDRLLERYMTVAWDSGATPLVILNKADLNDKAEFFKLQAETIAPGVEIIITSAEDGTGIDEILDYFSNGKVGAFIGPSGVGKSALTNMLLNKEIQKTGANRDDDKRGRHTTSSARMFELSSGGFIIDSPGLREIQLWADEDDLDNVFEEISSLAKDCKFTNCQHQGEPGCAVQAALESGEITTERYNSYLNLKKEIAFLNIKKSEKRVFLERQQSKEFTKYCKGIMKEKASMKRS